MSNESYFGGSAATPSSQPTPLTPPPPPPGWPGYPPPPTSGPWAPAPYQSRPPAPSNRRAWLIIGIVVPSLVVVGIVAAVVYFRTNVNGAKTATGTYLAALEHGDYTQAYYSLCPSDKSLVPESLFVTAKTQVHPVSYVIDGVSLRTYNGRTSAVVSYVDEESDGVSSGGLIALDKTGGSWQICHALLGDDTSWATG